MFLQAAKAAITGPLSADELAKVERGLRAFAKDTRKWEKICQTFMPYRHPKWLPRLYHAACDASDASGSASPNPDCLQDPYCYATWPCLQMNAQECACDLPVCTVQELVRL